MIAARSAPKQHTKSGFELANQLAFGRNVSLPNSARQLSAWNKIHNLATSPYSSSNGTLWADSATERGKPSAQDLSRFVPLWSCALRSRYRPHSAHLSLQLFNLFAQPLLGRGGRTAGIPTAGGQDGAQAVPVLLHAERALFLQDLRR